MAAHHLIRGGMKGKAERVSSAKVIEKHSDKEKARAEIRTRVGGSTVL